MTKRVTGIVMTAGVIVVVGGAAIVQAQPAPPPQLPPDWGEVTGNGSGSGSGSATTTRTPPTTTPTPATPGELTGNPYPTDTSDQPYQQPPPPLPVTPVKLRAPDPAIAMPEVLRSPTGWLLPAAVFYTKTSVDTGGGVSSNFRVGLGDVAEFGVSTTDDVRARQTSADADTAHEIQPYVTATFRMGVSEDRLFAGQPGLTLGFEKSFERKFEGFTTRTAELTLVASRRLGKHVALHIGGAFWDASLTGHGEGATKLANDASDDFALHTAGVGQQVVPFAGIQLEPIDRSEILIDLSWAPEFCYACTGNDQIKLQPELSWGVRYRVADWMNLESGVRLPNIGKADLLDAQIFGSITLTSWGLHHLVEDLK